MELFTVEKLKEYLGEEGEWTLFGEGYGAKIQKGGGNYKSDGVDFVLFDINVGGLWLKYGDMVDVANNLGIGAVPMVSQMGPLSRMVEIVKDGVKSKWGDFWAEGIVAKPCAALLDRRGNRIITKLKMKDF